ncbi:MAG: YkgJ family cysteine cluster protein [Planctomycetota bacterium]
MTTSEVWYAAGLRFACLQCGTCCTGVPGYVWLKPGEAEAIARHLGLGVEDFHVTYTRYTRQEYSLIEKPDGDCIFFDRDPVGCRIYPARPVQCRTFPFWTDNLRSCAHWQRIAAGCPGMDQGRLHTAAEVRRLGAANGPD